MWVTGLCDARSTFLLLLSLAINYTSFQSFLDPMLGCGRRLQSSSVLRCFAYCAAVRSVRVAYSRHVPRSLPLVALKNYRRHFTTSRCNMASSSTSGGTQLGVVNITSLNINTEMDSRVPLLLYFTVHNHPEVRVYTERLMRQVDQANRRREVDNFADVYDERGKDAGLAVKLGIVDCVAEPALSKKFNIDPHVFPILYFILTRAYLDTLTGMVEESQIKEAIDGFIDHAKEEMTNRREGKGIYSKKIVRHDNDDENAFTLLSKAHKHLQTNEITRARDLFSKSLEYSREEMNVVNERYGVKGKKLTAEMWDKLKREASYNSAPQAICGLAMCAMAIEDRTEAKRLVSEIRSEFPHATKDMLDVAEAVVRIELMILTDFHVKKDSYVSLMRYDNLTKDPVAFYRQHVKLAVAHFLEGAHQRSIEECLRIIRAEPKLLSALCEGGVLPPGTQLTRQVVTPARTVILGVMEALGPTNDHTITGRRMLQLYL